MENNKILIGVQFTDKDTNSNYYHYNIELYVLRDLPLHQLLEGIKYGLKKLASENKNNSDVYDRCRTIYSSCISKVDAETNGRQFLTHVTFTSFNDVKAEKLVRGGESCLLYTSPSPRD